MELLGHKEEKQNFKEKISEVSKENDLLKNDMRLLEKEMYFLIKIHKNDNNLLFSKEKNKENQNLSKTLDERIAHFTKEIENMKLMHSQELFIMKKKERKSKY